jgi:hypothetical protein
MKRLAVVFLVTLAALVAAAPCCRAAGSSSRRRATHPSASSARRSTSVQSWPLERSTGCGCPALGRRACVEDHLRPVTGGTYDSRCRRLGSPQSSREVPAEVTGGARRHRQGDGDTAEGSVFGGSGDLGGGRREPGGSGLAAGGAGQGRGRPPPATRRHLGPGPLRHGRSGPGLSRPGTRIGRPSPNQQLSCTLDPSRASSLRSSLRDP